MSLAACQCVPGSAFNIVCPLHGKKVQVPLANKRGMNKEEWLELLSDTCKSLKGKERVQAMQLYAQVMGWLIGSTERAVKAAVRAGMGVRTKSTKPKAPRVSLPIPTSRKSLPPPKPERDIMAEFTQQ